MAGPPPPRPSDPASVIREALLVDSYASPPRHTQIGQDAIAALARLEREAAERETALREGSGDDWLIHRLTLAEARVREVEAERDEALRLHKGKDDSWGRCASKLLDRAVDAEATVARQVGALREIAEWADRILNDAPAQTYAFDIRTLARAVLASPEAPAAEPPRPCDCDAPRCELYGCQDQPTPAALPAVDAPPRECICNPPGWLETRDENCPVHGRTALPDFWNDDAVDAPPEPR